MVLNKESNASNCIYMMILIFSNINRYFSKMIGLITEPFYPYILNILNSFSECLYSYNEKNTFML